MSQIALMRWRGACALLVVAAMAVTGCATGRYVGAPPYPGDLGRVMVSNLALTCPESIYLGPPLNRCADSLIIGGRPNWGYYALPDRFVAVYGPDKRLLWSAAGAVIGYTVARNVEGAVTGALAGYGIALATEKQRAQQRLRGPRLYTVSNPTVYVAEIFDGRRRVAELAPHTEAPIPAPEGVLTAHVKIPQGGRLREIVIELQSSGGTTWRVPAI